MDYTINEYAVIAFRYEDTVYSETVLLTGATGDPVTDRMKALAGSYGALEFKVTRKYTLTPADAQEPTQPVGVVVDEQA